MLDHDLDRTFAALADPTRRAILERLAQGEASVKVLAGPFEMTLQAISRHLLVLERAGLITRSRHAQFRPCGLAETPLVNAITWIDRCVRTKGERISLPAVFQADGGGAS